MLVCEIDSGSSDGWRLRWRGSKWLPVLAHSMGAFVRQDGSLGPHRENVAVDVWHAPRGADLLSSGEPFSLLHPTASPVHSRVHRPTFQYIVDIKQSKVRCRCQAR